MELIPPIRRQRPQAKGRDAVNRTAPFLCPRTRARGSSCQPRRMAGSTGRARGHDPPAPRFESEGRGSSCARGPIDCGPASRAPRTGRRAFIPNTGLFFTPIQSPAFHIPLPSLPRTSGPALKGQPNTYRPQAGEWGTRRSDRTAHGQGKGPCRLHIRTDGASRHGGGCSSTAAYRHGILAMDADTRDPVEYKTSSASKLRSWTHRGKQ